MTLAMVFPGQGSQSVGMLQELASSYSQVEETFREASDVLGYDLWALASEGPEGRLNQTRCTQPVMLCAGVAAWRCWQARGGAPPGVAAGHSLGEYSALVVAGSLDFPVAVSLVAERARLMQEAVPAGEGGIAAVLGLDDEQVTQLCAEVSETLCPQVVAAVNFNAPGQVVVAGHRDAVECALEAATRAGARRAVKLPMSVPVHCELMRSAATGLAPALRDAELRAPSFPILHNADLCSHSTPERMRGALSAQLFTPVRWSATVARLKQHGARTQVECGPGRVLSGLARRIDRSLGTGYIADPKSLDAALAITGAGS